MKSEHRKMLGLLRDYTNQIGGSLDGTSTSEAKLIDRQRANMLTSKILYAILADHPENDNRAIDFEDAYECLEQFRQLTIKVYPDRKGTTS